MGQTAETAVSFQRTAIGIFNQHWLYGKSAPNTSNHAGYIFAGGTVAGSTIAEGAIAGGKIGGGTMVH